MGNRGCWSIGPAQEKWKRRNQIEFLVCSPPEKIQANLKKSGYKFRTAPSGYTSGTKLVRRTRKNLQAEVDYLLQFDMCNEEGVEDIEGAVEVAMNDSWALGGELS